MNELGFKTLSDNFDNVYIPVRGMNISDQKKAMQTWKEIKGLKTNNKFLKKIQVLLKIIRGVVFFEISWSVCAIICCVIYLICQKN